MDKVTAIIVTYNRRMLLSECIDALRNQTRKPDTILVINNGSTDDTESWLKTQQDVEYINQKNIGSAGGFNTGIQHAFKNASTWVWCMDDDGYPEKHALEELLKQDNGDLRLLNCAVLDKEDRASFVWKTQNYKLHSEVKQDVIEGVGHPFNGTLLHRRIIERVGYPKQKFFLWGDETEYYYRIVKKNKIPVATVTNSIHYHPATRFSIKQDWNFSENWKMYYYVRNRFPVLQSKLNNRFYGLVQYLCFLAAFAAVIVFFQKSDKIKKLQAMLSPAVDAISNNYAMTPQIVTQNLQTLKAGPNIPGIYRMTIQKLKLMHTVKTPTMAGQKPLVG